MAYLFANTLTNGFNQPIGAWNTSNVRNMDAMFYNSGLFNQAIGAWNTGAVTTMSGMFWGANAFNQPIGTWNTGAVTNMNYMFYNALEFNQNINGWNVGAVVTKPPTNFVNTANSVLTAQNTPVWFTWTFTHSGVYPGTSVPTQQLLSDEPNVNTGWVSNLGNNTYIQADFGSVKTISSIIVGPNMSWGWEYLNGADVQYSSDGANWSYVTSNINPTNNIQLTSITYSSSISARYVRIIRGSGLLGVGTFNFTFA
jgi:surface protein